MNVAQIIPGLMRDQDADWEYQPAKDQWLLRWRSYGPMEATIGHAEIVAALKAAGENSAAVWAAELRADVLGPLADEPDGAEWKREFTPPLPAGESLGLILAEESRQVQGMALFSGDPGMVAERRTLVRLAIPAFDTDAGQEVWVRGAARAYL